MLKIAVPVVMAELGWMTMGVVDTVMVGPLGPEAISAAGVGNAMHIAFAIFGMAVHARPRHAGLAGLRRAATFATAIAGSSTA